MELTKAIVTLQSTSPYAQSRKHTTAKLEGESHDAYEERTWPDRRHIRTVNKGRPNERRTLVIPADAMSQSIKEGIKFLNLKIVGERNATWTKHFERGIAILEDIDLKIDPDTMRKQAINAHANGVRGSGTRVLRFYPTFDEWSAKFEVTIFDPKITLDIFRQAVEAAGLFIGIGQYRPQCLGTNGRWRVENIEWIDNRVAKPLKKAA